MELVPLKLKSMSRGSNFFAFGEPLLLVLYCQVVVACGFATTRTFPDPAPWCGYVS